MALSEARLRELVAADEGQYYDRKSLFEGPPSGKRPRDRRAVRDQIAEQVAGFANADGGVVIFGVEDDHSLTGHGYPADVVDQMLAVPQTRLVPPQAAGYRTVLDGIELLVFEVEAAPRGVRVDGDDRLEVLSPGGPPPEVSLDELRLGRPAHASRNPRVARVLSELGVMRDQGEGIPRMFEEMEVAFLPVPVLDVVSGRFCVVLRKEPIFASADPSWPQAVRALPISLTQKRALVGLVDRDFANADYCALNGVDRDTAYRELHELVDRDLLVMSGSGAGARYRVVRSSLAPPRSATPMEALEGKMREMGYITNADYREAFGVDRHAATAALSAWVATGVLVREGERRAARYLPGPRWPSH